MRASLVVVLVLVLVTLGCGSQTSSQVTARAPQSSEPERPSPEPDMTQYWANVAVIQERYCGPIAELSTRALQSCGCTPSGFTTADELSSSCSYHLISRISETEPMTVDEAALARCMAALDAALTGCTTARLPPSCEVARIFAPAPGALAFSRPVGSECRHTNGDEGFDAHFLCAPALHCDGTCVPGAPPHERPCDNPLALPGAFP